MRMTFDELAKYLHNVGFSTYMEGKAPARQLRVNKNHVGVRYKESDWTKWKDKERTRQLDDLNKVMAMMLELQP